jgi:tetratricopeptide (TPR) repeat protein
MMHKVFVTPFLYLFLFATLMLGTAPYAMAYTTYDVIEIEYDTRDNKVLVEVEYILDEDDSAKDDLVRKEYTFFTTNLNTVWEKLADKLDVDEDDIEDILDGEYGDNQDDTTRDEADEVLDEAIFLLGEAEFEIEDIDDEDDLIAAGKLFNDAEGVVADAQNSFGLGDYGDAKEFAQEAVDILEAILDEDYDFDPDEKNDEEEEDAEDAIAEAEEAVAEAEEYIEELDEDGVDVDELEEYLEISEEYLDRAEEALDDEDYDEAEEYAEKAEAKAEFILDYDEDEKDDDADKEEDKDDKDDKYEGDKDEKDDDADYYSDFGKTEDREELQRQLQLLLTLLIQLLQEQL